MYSCVNHYKSNYQDSCADDTRRWRWIVKCPGFHCFRQSVNPDIMIPENLTMGNCHRLWHIDKMLHLKVRYMCHRNRHAVAFRRAATTFNGKHKSGFASAVALCHTYASCAERQQYQHSKRYCYFRKHLHFRLQKYIFFVKYRFV